MTHYHVTASHNVEGILAEGLRKDHGGWDAGFVWFFDDLGLARSMARTGTWGGPAEHGNAVIAVDTTGLEVIADPHPGWGRKAIGGKVLSDHAFAYPESIPPERITVAA